MNKKKCTNCGKNKPLSDFYANKCGKFGVDSRCKPCKLECHKKWVQDNRERAKKTRQEYFAKPENREREQARCRAMERRCREKVINHYGGRCLCCGENRYEFLAIDHISGGGNQHRKSDKTTVKMARWIIKNNYPSDFRILCHNCNCSLGHHGFCPHNPDFR